MRGTDDCGPVRAKRWHPFPLEHYRLMARILTRRDRLAAMDRCDDRCLLHRGAGRPRCDDPKSGLEGRPFAAMQARVIHGV